uniref:Aldehyde dehydrogenase domain-containing protein n=1 Tax=Leersia perrieri TaxID=77586 RepID=A0A0D9VIW5_9ORYZ
MEEKPQNGGSFCLGGLVAGVREVHESGRTKEMEWRQAQIRGLIRMLTEEEDAVFDALHEDLGKHRVESFRDEVGNLVKSFRNTLQNLKKWVAPEKASCY